MSLDFTLYENWCEHCHKGSEVASFNITHNLTSMAEAAGIYDYLWRPDEIACFVASDITQFLEDGIKRLEADPERFIKLNSPNGWGTYPNLIRFAKSVLEACRNYPDARIGVWR